jgi:prephenate dehydrogenase
MQIQTTCIIGLGLIGGSMAYALKHYQLTQTIIGIDENPNHVQEALALGIIDASNNLTTAVSQADLIIIATPVNVALGLLNDVLNNIKPSAIVFDLGSTKNEICTIANQHKNGQQFVAAHPMWGTEFSGPSAAQKNAFINKAVVLCNTDYSNKEAVALVNNIFKTIGMHIIHMNANDHDTHVAYISHISHITSFALANTVLEKEKEEDAIFELASGGFESTVRLAKSNAQMWVPIFMQNKENVLDVLNEHISQLRKFKAALEKENESYLYELIQQANKIKTVLDKKE